MAKYHFHRPSSEHQFNQVREKCQGNYTIFRIYPSFLQKLYIKAQKQPVKSLAWFFHEFILFRKTLLV
ncbi:MAG: hypothetical protein ACYSUY_13290, partial [Planctomycetota bacterium]